ncbi:mannan-binding lectin isoform 1, partial [Aphelenchoides avenae]
FAQLYTKDDEACKIKANETNAGDVNETWLCHLWLGLRSIPAKELTFGWSDGTVLNKAIYANWASGEPNDKENDCCVEMFTKRFRGGAAKQWNDINCSWPMKVVCEQSAKLINFAPNTCTQ